MTWLLFVFAIGGPEGPVDPAAGHPIAIFASPVLCEVSGAAITMQLMVETAGHEGQWMYRCVAQQGTA